VTMVVAPVRSTVSTSFPGQNLAGSGLIQDRGEAARDSPEPRR
jgi:hypothetical protein